jgi:2'-5' RNA ligase
LLKAKNKETSNVQIELPAELSQKIKHLGASIAKEDLAGDGVEIDVPHITIRWGIESDDCSPLQQIVDKYMPFFVRLSKTKSFEPGEDGSVPLFVQVESKKLGEVRKAVEAAYECRPDDHPDYKPHITIAFVKPEVVSKYDNESFFEGYEWIVRDLTLSDRNRTKTTISVGGNPESIVEKRTIPRQS